MKEGARNQGPGVSGVSARAAPWLAWSLMGLSVALLLGWIALARMTAPTDLELPYHSTLDVVLTLAIWLPFSVVGAIVASRHPRNTIGWIFCTTALVVGLGHLANGYAEYWLAGGWAQGTLVRLPRGSARGCGPSR